VVMEAAVTNLPAQLKLMLGLSAQTAPPNPCRHTDTAPVPKASDKAELEDF
jgi:hypothetical protein